MLSSHHCRYLEKLGQNRVGVLKQIKQITDNCKGLLTIMEKVQRKKIGFAAKKVKTKGCNISNKLPGLWKSFKSWMYLIFIIATISKHSSGIGKHTTERTSFIFPRHFSSVAFQGNEEAVTSPTEHDSIKSSKSLNINCHPDKQCPIYTHGQMVALANKDATQ
eukprot:4503923-Ditylum_brightwellii.AAC.1